MSTFLLVLACVVEQAQLARRIWEFHLLPVVLMRAFWFDVFSSYLSKV